MSIDTLNVLFTSGEEVDDADSKPKEISFLDLMLVKFVTDSDALSRVKFLRTPQGVSVGVDDND